MGEFIQETEAFLGQEEQGIVVMDGRVHFYTTYPVMRLEGATFISASPWGGITRRANPGPSRRPVVVADVQLLHRVQLFAVPWTAARPASPSFTISQGRPAMGLENLFPPVRRRLTMAASGQDGLNKPKQALQMVTIRV